MSTLSQGCRKCIVDSTTNRLVPGHFQEVKERREHQTDKILTAVKERLVKEINYWSDHYIRLSEDVAAGKQPKVQLEMARRRVEELTARLEQRKKELNGQRNVVSAMPVVIGGALVIPQGLLAQRKGEPTFSADADARAHIEQTAMQAVMKAEQALGHEVFDVSAEKCGWDITARPPMQDGKIPADCHIEVKGRAKGADTVTVSRNEILYGLNQSDKFILAVVLVDGNEVLTKRGKQPCQKQNRLLFLAPDADSLERLEDQVRVYLAFIGVQRHRCGGDAPQSGPDTNDTFRWLMSPVQEVRRGRLEPKIVWDAVQVSPAA